MDESATSVAAAAHLVAVPFPGRGHVNAVLSFCDILLRYHGANFVVTIVVTEEWLALIHSSRTHKFHPHLRFAAIPNVIPSERNRGADHPGFLRAVMTNMEPHFEQLLASIDDPRPTAIVADILPWVVDVSIRLGFPFYSYFPMPPPFFYFIIHCEGNFGRRILSPSRPDHEGEGHQFGYRSNREEVIIDLTDEDGAILAESLPGIGCGVRLADFSSVVSYAGAALRFMSRAARRARGIILNAVYEIDIPIIDALRVEPELLNLPVYTVGPCITNLFDEESTTAAAAVTQSSANAPVGYITWLDLQPVDSVLYISLGSFMPISTEQVEEIVQGLVDAEASFLWVLREEWHSPGLLEKLKANAGRGMTVPWCEQLRVLRHPSVGAFLTHCGWNSTLEGLSAGKPMLAFPIFWDQPINSAMVSDGWGVGVRLKEAGQEKEVVGRTVISDAVKKVMGPAGEGFRRKARELREVCLGAFREGTGSSLSSLHAFVQDVLAAGKLG